MRVMRWLSATFVSVTLLGSLMGYVPPATASTPPADTSDCSHGFSNSKPTSTTVRFTVTMTCTSHVSGLRHDLTVQRSGKVIAIQHKACSNVNHTLTFKCSASYTYTDPSGTQTYQVLDEFSAYGGTSGGELFAGKRIYTFLG